MNKQDWTYKKFEDCLVKAAKAKQVQTTEYNSGTKYPIISQEDKMVSGYCDDDSLLYHIDNPVVIFGDHTRVLKYVDFDFVVGADGVKILIPKDFLKAKFLLYYLRWYQVPSLGYSRHYKLLKEIVLPVPPIEEQERIVAELDLLSGIIEKKKGQLKAYDQLAQSIFYTMFGDPIDNPKGWEYIKLSSLINDNVILYHLDGNHGGDYPRSDEFVNEGVPYIGANCICDGLVNFSMAKYLPIDRANKLRKGLAKNGDVLFAHNATVGPVAYLNTKEPLVILSTSLTAYRCNENKLNPLFLRAYMQSTWFESQYKVSMKQTTRNQIPITQQKKMNFILPPLSLQEEFAEKIEAIERQKALVQQSIDETQTMFDYTMDKYFG